MSRYCVFRYRAIKTRYRVIFPDIGPYIGNIGADIGTISGHTRSLPNPILPISGPISGFFSILATVLGQYRDITVPCQTRYWVFHRYRARFGPDMAKNIGYTDIGTKKPRYRSQCVCNIAIYRYCVLPISDVFPDIGDYISPAAPPPPVGYCLHPWAQRATAEKGPGLGWCHILRVTCKT